MSTPDQTLDTPQDHPPNACFGCGVGNPDGMQLEFQRQPEEGRASCRARIPARFSGAPGVLHGGIVALLLDEAMAKVNSTLGTRAPTVHLEVDFLEPVPAEADILIEGWRERVEGRRVTNAAELRSPDGHTLARARGTFVIVKNGWPPPTGAGAARHERS